MAAFPAASRSPMMSEPTTAAKNAVPRASATARRATALLCGRLHGTDKRAHEFPLNLRRDGVHVDAFTHEKLPRVFDVINAGRLNVDLLEAGFGELCEYS
jgi:hypothetical protein